MSEPIRLSIEISGLVQGVGFRPFVYRLATQSGLSGMIKNRADGVIIEVEGERERVERFYCALLSDGPHGSFRGKPLSAPIELRGGTKFVIAPSIVGDDGGHFIPVDQAPCEECISEFRDRTNRRYHYPFISCATCGPRYTIMSRLPFDRAHTSLVDFPLCDECLDEYNDPGDRRFHAQTINCPECGPRLWLESSEGEVIDSGYQALEMAATAIRNGLCVALKGVGGFHLVCDALSDRAIELLRHQKGRGNKPFAVMYPSLERILMDAIASADEQDLLSNNRAPLVLLKARSPNSLSRSVSGVSPYLGVMLPSSPLQRGLLDCVGGPIVATSGNRSGEPICADNQVARQRLRGIADLFLFHDRNIVHPCDDAILQIVAGSPLLRRLGRGYAPVTIERRAISDAPIFGFGGLFKSTVAIGRGDTIVISPYHGSAECPEVADRRERFIELVAPIGSFNKGKPQLIASDLHPELREYIPAHAISHPVQHHRAHGWSVVGEHGIRPPVCAVVFDGSGYSPDGTIWGGEWLVLSDGSEERRLSLKPFFLIGGDSASKLPERVAAALWYQWLGDEAFESTVWGRLEDSAFLSKLISAGSHCTLTSSVGRLFDGVSSVLGLCHHNTFEGEAAMMLEGEALCTHFPDCCNGFYPVRFSESTVDVVPLIAAIDQDMRDGYPRPTIAMRFHRSVIEMIVQGAQQIGIGQVLLTGGCFQNAVLLSGAIARLRECGFTPYWQRTIPCSDEGLSVGQVVVAAGALRNGLRV